MKRDAGMSDAFRQWLERLQQDLQREHQPAQRRQLVVYYYARRREWLGVRRGPFATEVDRFLASLRGKHGW